MNRDKIEGKLDEVKGNIKKRIGGATEDPAQQAEGWVEEKKGQIQQKIGDVEDESARREDDADRDRTS